MIKILDKNNPEIYLMPVKTWNEILGSLQYYEEALEYCRKGRENWKAKFYAEKKKNEV